MIPWGYTWCSGCYEEVDWDEIVYNDGDVAYCREHPKLIEMRREQLKRYKEIGHTGDSMCGCQMCAIKYEREHD